MPIDVPKGRPIYRIAMSDPERQPTGDVRFGEALAGLRQAKGLSQAQLGERIGKNQNTVSDYETGMRMPKSKDVRRLAKALEAERLNELLPGPARSAMPNPAEKLAFGLSKRAMKRLAKTTPAQQEQLRRQLEALIETLGNEPAASRPKRRR